MPIIINCSTCKKRFSVIPSHAKKAKYCSNTCRAIGNQSGEVVKCFYCGNRSRKFKYQLKKNKTFFCSNDCKLKYQTKENHPKWKHNGVLRIDSQGYKIIKTTEYPKGIYEHRFVMQNSVGRKLTRNEHVHHINGNKLDNNINNLMLLSHVEHPKFHQLTKWSKNYDSCVKCGLSNKKHKALGLCHNCYQKQLMGKRRKEADARFAWD